MYYNFISYFKETVFSVFGNWIDFVKMNMKIPNK